MPIAPSIRQEIIHRIKQAELQYHVKILYAIESGSRAWGFASPNSDYDVRFIYAHPKDWYIAVDLEQKRDVIEYEIVDEIDINGWDVRKALQLFAKSNPAFIEWIQSPIIYVDDGLFAQQARLLQTSIYSIERGIYHYRSMAKTNYRGYLRAANVPLKKYFYVLRPLLAILWLEKYQQPAPVEFEKLMTLISDNKSLTKAIEQLLTQKKASLEKQLIPSIPAINEFIEAELQRLESYSLTPKKSVERFDLLNKLLHKVIE